MAGNDSFTKVLLHFSGADASTTITDSNAGGSAKTWTAAGNAQIDTADFKFNASSLLFDGTGDYVSTPDHADFTVGSSAFTLDTWVKTSTSGRMAICGASNSAGGNTATSYVIEKDASNKPNFYVFVGSTQYIVTGTTSINTGAWVHLAAVRTGNILKLFVNGTQEGGDVAITEPVNDAGTAFTVGRYGDVTSIGHWNGWIDEFRFSNGIARWTANFTPETAAYFQEFTLTQTPVKNVAVAGVAAFLRLNRMLAAVKANVVVAGVSVTLQLQRMLAAVKANVQITGIDANLVSVRITALVGNVVAAGVAVALRYTRVWRIASSNVQVLGIRVFTDPRASGTASARAGGGIASRASVTAGPQLRATAGSQRIRAY